MKIFTGLLLAILITSCSAPCIEGQGEPKNEKRSIQAFTEIEMKCSAELELLYSPKTRVYSVVIEAEENLMPFITSRVEGGKLVIDTDQCLKSGSGIKVTVPFSQLESILNSGSGGIRCSETFPFEQTEVVNEGSGSISLKMEGEDIRAFNYGSGELKIQGVGLEMRALNSGSGSLDLVELMSRQAKVRNEGSGSMKIWVEDEANIELNGSGDIGYRGNPREVSEENSGSGKIYRLD